MGRILFLFLLLLLSSCLQAADKPVQVMLIASYHMNYSAADFNIFKSVDVLSEARQSQIDAVVNDLSLFRPTQIVVDEANDRAQQEFAAYREGTLSETANEIVQLGFKLARKNRVDAVRGIPSPGSLSIEPLARWTRDRGGVEEIEKAVKLGEYSRTQLTDLYAAGSVAAWLQYLNDSRNITAAHGFVSALMKQPGADEATTLRGVRTWNERLELVCAEIIGGTKPGDRVVALYGQAHFYALKQCLAAQPNVYVIDSRGFLPRK